MSCVYLCAFMFLLCFLCVCSSAFLLLTVVLPTVGGGAGIGIGDLDCDCDCARGGDCRAYAILSMVYAWLDNGRLLKKNLHMALKLIREMEENHEEVPLVS